MALNPRIMAIPPQHTNREEHIHRFLTSLPNLEPRVTDLQTHIDDRGQAANEARGMLDNKSSQGGADEILP